MNETKVTAIAQEQVRALFVLAGIPVFHIYDIENQSAGVADRQLATPWYLICTPYGVIKIGWHDRVLEIDWAYTKVRKVITQDRAGKSETMVRARTYKQALGYLEDLSWELEQSGPKNLMVVGNAGDQGGMRMPGASVG